MLSNGKISACTAAGAKIVNECVLNKSEEHIF